MHPQFTLFNNLADTATFSFFSLHGFAYIGLFQKKSTPPPTDGILEILAGGGVEDSGNPGGRGGWP